MTKKLNGILTPDKLFFKTDCLSLKTLQKYLEDQLTTNQMQTVEKHLPDCELCSDALDGFSMMPDGSNAEKNVTSINKQIRAKTAAGKTKIIYLDFRRIAAAAAIIIVFTSTIYIVVNNYFPFNKNELLADLREEMNEQGENKLPSDPLKGKRDGKVSWGDGMGTVGDVKDDTLRSEMFLSFTSTSEIADDREILNIPKTKKSAGEGNTGEKLILDKSSVKENDIKNVESAAGMYGNEITSAGYIAENDDIDANEQEITVETDIYDRNPEPVQKELVLNQIHFSGKSDNTNKSRSKSKYMAKPMQTAKSKGKTANNIKQEMPAEEETEQVFLSVDKAPEFPGGIQKMEEFILQNLKYPESARKKAIRGEVNVSFIIDENGFIKDIKIVKGIISELDEEAVRIIKLMPQWKPGEKGSKKVAVRLVIPIEFNL